MLMRRAPVITAMLFFMTAFSLSALPPEPPVPYNSYNYGVWDESVPATPAYAPEYTANGFDLGVGELKNPKDLCKDSKGNVYILDSGNRRIVVVDPDLKLIRVIDTFKHGSGPVALVEPEGVCVDSDGFMYIADRGLKAVLVADPAGRVVRKITKPVSDLVDESSDFLPIKVLTDTHGLIYVISFGSYEGAYTFDSQGGFLGFFGSNKVNVSSKLLADRFWRLFATKEQRERMHRYVPMEYANFAIDHEGFVYTVSNFGDNEQRGQVRKLNPLSQNILFAGSKPNLMFFGDWETTYTNRVEKSSLVAIDVDDEDFISVLDTERGRVFQYDQMSNLIAIFGGPGDQNGTFRRAVDLVSSAGRIVVLDEVKSSLTVFAPTRFGRALRAGTVLYEEGEYEKALRYWFEALKLDRSNWQALRGIGRAYERMGRFTDAMAFYKESEHHGMYSTAFREARTVFLRRSFPYIGTFIVALMFVPIVLGAVKRKKKLPAHAIPEGRVRFISKKAFPFYLVVHPFKGWEELKREGQGSLALANVILAAWFVMQIISYQFTGFSFNFNRLDQMNVALIFASTVGIALLWSISNWGLCTLQDGKGSFKEVWIFTAYSRMSYVLAAIPLVVLSNILVQEEGFFFSMALWLVNGWSWVQLLLAVRAVHLFEMKQTIITVLLTILGIVLIVVIIALFVSLFSQVYNFCSTIVQEILLRT